MQKTQRLTVLLSFSGSGGVERMMLNLLPEFLRAGVAVELLAILRKPSPDLVRVEGSGLKVLDLGVTHTGLAVPELARYLKAERPPVLLVAKDRAIRAAVLAKRMAGVNTRLVGRLGTHLSASLAHKPALLRWLRTRPMRLLYPMVDELIAISRGVAEDTSLLTCLPENRIHIIRNPVITPELYRKSLESVEHPWFQNQDVPIVLGAGRLTHQKDFETLIRAFSLLRVRQNCRLVILGEGRSRHKLEQLSAELGIREHVSFTGYVANPYAYMAKASLFVLSSLWEGSGNVLTEAMALGTPVISTDCPSGPREMLADGLYGPLVPIGNSEKMAAAMQQTLQHPPQSSLLKEAVAEYAVERSARHYLDVLGFESNG
jgi:glycosyltransferase involved in cell wall biosynthesis